MDARVESSTNVIFGHENLVILIVYPFVVIAQ
jgi:hypothetical protein